MCAFMCVCVCVCVCLQCVCVSLCVCTSMHTLTPLYISVHIPTRVLSVWSGVPVLRVCAPLCVFVYPCACSMGVSDECICMHINVGCVSAELLTQTGHEKKEGTLDCCLHHRSGHSACSRTVNCELKTLSANPEWKKYFSASLTI